MAHKELARKLTNLIVDFHTTRDKETAVNDMNNLNKSDFDKICSDIREDEYFGINENEYDWSQIYTETVSQIEKDYREKLNLVGQVINNLKNKPPLGTPAALQQHSHKI